MLPLAGILLGIIEQAQNIEMLDIEREWIEDHKEKIHEMRLYGKLVYDWAKSYTIKSDEFELNFKSLINQKKKS